MSERSGQATNGDGFTLLELLVALAILSLIVVSLTEGLGFASRAWEAQERRSARQDDLDAVQNILRHLLASANGFEGDAGSLRFVSTLPVALGLGGLYDVELRNSANHLWLAWKPHFKGPGPIVSSTEIELIESVTGFELAFYIPPGGWQRVLKAGLRPPALVRIDLQLGEERAWPPLVVAPMIDASSRTGD